VDNVQKSTSSLFFPCFVVVGNVGWMWKTLASARGRAEKLQVRGKNVERNSLSVGSLLSFAVFPTLPEAERHVVQSVDRR
jgi:hypothetical protein